MNRTKSGNFAIGSPMSQARIESEAEYSIKNNLKLLSKTEEGSYLKSRFELNTGMTEKNDNYDFKLYVFLRRYLST